MHIRLAVRAVGSGVLSAMILAQAAYSAESTTRVRPWRDYRTIMWIGDSGREHPEQFGLFLRRLREMGINTAMVYDDGNPQPLVDNGFPYYVENLVNRGLCLKFSSQVSDWDKFVTDWARDGRRESGLIRDYCLDDPRWLNWAKTVTQTIVRKNRVHQPLAYNLRDELSTTISANPFDYDFNPIALEQFRVWLKTQYAELAALNAEWQTRFESWEQVKPFTTDEIKNRMATGEALPRGHPDWQQVQQTHFEPALAQRNPTAWNFAPWADFRTYMDLSLARALDQLRQAAHDLDPATPVGIEGTQMPHAFGGYDLWRLSRVLDWVEPYDIGSAREIFGSFMADKPVLTTVFESETRPARRRLWHLLLEGDRGCLVWWSEDCLDWKRPELPLTPKARALAPVLRDMTSPLARLFLRAKRVADPIFIHYSQPSIQVDWLLESRVDGSTWLRRFSGFESGHNQMAKTRTAWLKGLQDLGFTPRFISSAELEEGKLRGLRGAVLVLPESWALSQKERAEIGLLADPNGTAEPAGEVLVEGEAGAFDEHARFVGTEKTDGFLQPALTNLGCLALNSTTGTTSTNLHSRGYLAERLKTETRSAWLTWLEGALSPKRPVVLVRPNAQVRVHRFQVKAGRLLAFERNIEYQMSEELKQAGGNQALETPVQVVATLAEPAELYDLRSGAYLGHTDRLRFTLDPWEPSLFALLPKKVPEQSLMTELERE